MADFIASVMLSFNPVDMNGFPVVACVCFSSLEQALHATVFARHFFQVSFDSSCGFTLANPGGFFVKLTTTDFGQDTGFLASAISKGSFSLILTEGIVCIFFVKSKFGFHSLERSVKFRP